MEDDLAKKRVANRTGETIEVKVKEPAKLREATGEAVDRIDPSPPTKGTKNAITEGEAKLAEGRKNLKTAQKEAAEAKGKPEAADLEKKAADLEKKLDLAEKEIGKAKSEHRDLQAEWKAAEEEARLIEGDITLHDRSVIDAARDRLDHVRTRAKLAEKKVQDALAEPEAPKQIDIGGQKLESSYGEEAQKWLDEHPNYVDKFNKAQEKGLVGPKGESGIVRSELPDYDFKLKILGEGGNYRIHGKKVGDKIVWDKVMDHD